MANQMFETSGVSWTSPAQASIRHPQPTRRRRVTMKKHILGAVAGVLALGFGVSIANAAAVPCVVAYEHPAKAAAFKANMVQAFVSCGNTGGNTPNADADGPGTTPTCYPAQTLNEKAGSPANGWHWGPKSAASI